MAPQKKSSKLTTSELHKFAEDYGIKFKGPVPPNEWPNRYRHLFQVIHDISSNRYANYDRRPDSDLKLKKDVRGLRISAQEQRDDVNSNEDAWRVAVEAKILSRFDQEIICNDCRNQIYISQYQAEPFDSEDRAHIIIERSGRQLCRCNDGVVPVPRNQNRAPRQSKIFTESIGIPVSHHPADNLNKSKIPMKPDRVVGLRMNETYQRCLQSSPAALTPCPTGKPHLIYPFLVVEAKREKDAPGFRYVEMQTAFPIRRFLKIQAELQLASQLEQDPLVWFFGFQGEDWRLYGAVLDDHDPSKVNIYHLWHGIIESLDSALQVFQIIDFIWTWARDVYRPQIRRSLQAHLARHRSLSPTSTAPFSRDQSVLSAYGVRTLASPQSQPPPNGVQSPGTTSIEARLQFSDARLHPFLRRAGSDVSRPCAPDCSIRHSDIILFSFRSLDIPENFEDLRAVMGLLRGAADEQERMMYPLNLIRQDQFSHTMRKGHIRQIEEFWTGIASEHKTPSSNAGPMVKVFFFFRTFFQHKDWQLKRELYCVTFSKEAADLITTLFRTKIDCSFDENIQMTNPDDIIHELRNLRHLSGRQSVGNAMIEAALYASRCKNDRTGEIQVKWQLTDQRIRKDDINKLADLFISLSVTEDTVRSYHRQSESLIFIHRTVEAAQALGVTSGLQDIPEDVGQNEAMLIVRANHWPRECPKFCLFVLVDENFDDTMRLGQFLHRAISAPEMYLTGELPQHQPLSKREKDSLRTWDNSWRC